MVNVRLHTRNWRCNLPGSALKVPVVVVVLGGWLESEHSDRLWLSFSLALAKPNKRRLKVDGPNSSNAGYKAGYKCMSKLRSAIHFITAKTSVLVGWVMNVQ